MTRLQGKRIAVVGAGSVGDGWGNGKAAAVSFARQGAHVFCVDRDGEAAGATVCAIGSEGGTARAMTLDATADGAGEALLAEMEAAYGGIDVMHFNIGISCRGGVADTTDEDWDRVFNLNLRSAFRLTRAVLPTMRDVGGGVLTYVSSIAAVLSGPYAYASYEASKAALGRMARSVARENAPFGIRANVILPGLIDTPHVHQYIDPQADRADLARARSALVPLGRQGTAWDVAHAAVFLASDEASFISGIDLKVDGGMSA